MESIINSQTNGQDSLDVIELILDEWNGSSLEELDKILIESFTNLEFLSLNGCGLENLNNFPDMPNLIKLDLSNNRISSGLSNLNDLKELMQLSLSGNKIKLIDEVIQLVNLENLICLDIERCPVSEVADHVQKLFDAIPQLQILNEKDRLGNKVNIYSSEEEISEGELRFEADKPEENRDEEENLDLLDEENSLGEFSESEFAGLTGFESFPKKRNRDFESDETNGTKKK